MIIRMGLLFLCFCQALAAADPPDPAVSLARILAGKGVITADELSAVASASTGARVDTLSSILQRKGLLTTAEAAQIWTEPSGPRAVLAQAALPAAAPQPAAAKQAAPPAGRTTGIPVVTQAHVGVSLYGTLLFNAFSDTNATNIQDLPLLVSKAGSNPTAEKSYGQTARQTRLGLRLHEDDVAGATLTGQFEFDLFGGKTPLANGMDMDMFRLRLAYGRLDWKHAAFEAGQDWGVWAPLNPISYAMYAIPEFSASGNPWIRLPQVRGEFFTGPSDSSRLLVQVAALDPNVGDYPTTPFSTARQPGIGELGRMPSFETRVAWTEKSDDRDYTVGLSGHYGRGRDYGMVNGDESYRPVDSWGVALDYSLPFTSFFNLTGEAFEGRALGIYSVTSGESVGPLGTPGSHGVESRGGWVQAQFNFAKKWQTNLAYGIEVPNASELPVGGRWRNQTYMGNIVYKLTPNVLFALEYRRIITEYRNQQYATGRGNYVNLAIGYLF